MARDVKRRAYTSVRRQQQARHTRRAVLAAARECFVERGYGATTLQDVADKAGVAVQTIYAVFGNKRTVLEQLLDVAIAGDDEEIAVKDREWMRPVFESPDARIRLATYAAAVRRIAASAGDVFVVLQAAASTDPDVVPLADEAERRRRDGAKSIVAGLAALGALRRELPEAVAVDLLWTLNSPEVFRLLVRESGWDLDAYQRWLAVTMQDQLLAPAPDGARGDAVSPGARARGTASGRRPASG